LIQAAREPEVEHAHATVVADQHVVGLEVTVHEPGRVRSREPAPGLDELLDDVLDAIAIFFGLPLPQRDALDELHRDEHLLAKVADLVHLHDVRVRGLGERLRLTTQPRDVGALFVDATQQLDRNLAIELGVVGGVHDPHAAGPEPLEHGEAADPHRVGRGPEHARGDRVAQVLRVDRRDPNRSMAKVVAERAFERGLVRLSLVVAAQLAHVGRIAQRISMG
jgi:hypothetical protein